MITRRVGCVPVVDREDGSVKGIITQTDLLIALVTVGRSLTSKVAPQAA